MGIKTEISKQCHYLAMNYSKDEKMTAKNMKE